jgi:hypothetical protein
MVLLMSTYSMAIQFRKLQRVMGGCAFALALVFTVWLPLGIFNVVPFVLELPGESSLRVHAAAAVGCLMIAAWGFWD